MALPDGHLKNVCRVGQGVKCCAYLAMGGPNVEWACAKGMADIKVQIDARLAEGTMVAQGDNCSGPPNYEEATRG